MKSSAPRVFWPPLGLTVNPALEFEAVFASVAVGVVMSSKERLSPKGNGAGGIGFC